MYQHEPIRFRQSAIPLTVSLIVKKGKRDINVPRMRSCVTKKTAFVCINTSPLDSISDTLTVSLIRKRDINVPGMRSKVTVFVETNRKSP